MAEPCSSSAQVSKAFGGLQCIDHLDLVVGEGEIVSVIGPNGAGKTTLFNLVTGIYRPDAGDIRLDGKTIVGLAPHTITNRGIARTFQTLRLFLNMTVKENVMAATYGSTHATIAESMLRLPRARREERESRRFAEEKLAFFGQRLMGYRWNQPAYSLSYANRRRLEIARATATNPRILLARRAGRGHESGRDARDHRADRAAPARGRLHDPRHRARHARRRGNLRSGRRPRSRREDRRRDVRPGRDGPRVVEAYLGTSVTGAAVSEFEAARRCAAPARGRQHLLRADAHPPGRQPDASARASSSACSAGTPPASPRR